MIRIKYDIYKQLNGKKNNRKKQKINGHGNIAEQQPSLFVMSLRRASIIPAKIMKFQTPQLWE